MAEKFNPENQGEGNRDSARRYNQAVQKHAQSGQSDGAAQQAREDLEGPDAEELRQAEREGKKRIAEEDPEVDSPLDKSDRNADRSR